MNQIELLAPAGDLTRLKTAVRYGADAVYIGGKQFSLRSRASNFSLADIKEGAAFAKQYGAKVHVTVNMLPHEEDLSGLSDYLTALQECGVHAIICASPAIMMCAKQVAPKLEVHVSTQHSLTNSAAVNYWKSKGADRVVLARELTLSQLKEVKEHSELPLEVFIHGGMCISYSGRCMLSNHMALRDANRGGCAQSCRWKYRLYDNGKPIHDEATLFSMSSKDLMGARFLPELMQMGIASVKIEGRMKSTYYIATLVHTYRMLIDELLENGSVSDEKMDWYCAQLAKAENRPFATGFFQGVPKAQDHLYGINGAGISGEYIADVIDYDSEQKMAVLKVRNKFDPGIKAEVFAPHEPLRQFVISQIYDEEDMRLETANQPMRIVKIPSEFPMSKHAMIRKVIDKKRQIE